jgi:prepilin-type N-terminal cleavage/methylation domain-containing protein
MGYNPQPTRSFRAVAGRRAMTLVELVVVMVIISVMLGVAVVAMSGSTSRARVRAGAQELLSALRFARATAAARGPSGSPAQVIVQFVSNHAFVVRDMTLDDPTTGGPPPAIVSTWQVEGEWIGSRFDIGFFHGMGDPQPPANAQDPPLTTEKTRWRTFGHQPTGETYEFRDSRGLLAPRYPSTLTPTSDRFVFLAGGQSPLMPWAVNNLGYDRVWVRATFIDPEGVNPPDPPALTWPPASPNDPVIGIQVDRLTGRAFILP